MGSRCVKMLFFAVVLLPLATAAGNEKSSSPSLPLKVRVVEQGDQHTRFLNGANITLIPTSKHKSTGAQQVVKSKTNNGGIARISELHPNTNYKVLVQHPECGQIEKSLPSSLVDLQGRTVDMRFQGPCKPSVSRAKSVAALPVAAHGGGAGSYQIKVKLEQHNSSRGAGLWVAIVDKNGRELIKRRSQAGGWVGTMNLSPGRKSLAEYQLVVKGLRGEVWRKNLSEKNKQKHQVITMQLK